MPEWKDFDVEAGNAVKEGRGRIIRKWLETTGGQLHIEVTARKLYLNSIYSTRPESADIVGALAHYEFTKDVLDMLIRRLESMSLSIDHEIPESIYAEIRRILVVVDSQTIEFQAKWLNEAKQIA